MSEVTNEAPAVEEAVTEAPVAETLLNSAPVEAATEEVDFVTDEEALPTGEEKKDYEWVFDKYKTENGEFDKDGAAAALASLNKKLNDKGMLAPESADEYDLTLENKDLFVIDDQQIFNDESVADTKAFFQEIGLPAKFAQPLLERYASNVGEVLADMKNYVSSQTYTADVAGESLKETWGKDFDANLSAANRAISTYYDGDITEHKALANNPVFAQIMANIGREVGEDRAPRANSVNTSVSEAKIEELMSDPNYWDKMNDPESETYKIMNSYYK